MAAQKKCQRMGSAGKKGHGARWCNSSSVKQGEEGKREGGMEGQRDGGMGTSVDTSVLIAVFQGSYSTYLLSISYFFFTFKVLNIWEYLLWGTECGLVIMFHVYYAPHQISANSKNSWGDKWPMGVPERVERWASHSSCLPCLVHLHQQTQEQGVQILQCNAGGSVSQLLCQHLILSHVPFQNVTSSITGDCWALAINKCRDGFSRGGWGCQGPLASHPLRSDGICCVTELCPHCHTGSCHSARFVASSSGNGWGDAGAAPSSWSSDINYEVVMPHVNGKILA